MPHGLPQVDQNMDHDADYGKSSSTPLLIPGGVVLHAAFLGVQYIVQLLTSAAHRPKSYQQFKGRPRRT